MISDSIISTLIYSDHFGFPLTQIELHTRLVGERISQKSLISQLSSMLSSKMIEKTRNFYHLPGRKTLVTRRIKRLELSNAPRIIANSRAREIGAIPGVLAVFLTGSLAMNNSDPSSDIDLMIITRPNMLWLTRLFVTLYTSILGLRRSPGARAHSGKLCLNLYLTPDTLVIPPSKQSLYSAYELIQASPLYDPQNLYPKLLLCNSWIKNYLPNFKPKLVGEYHYTPDYNFISLLLVPLEFLAYHAQRLYMRKRLTRELITRNSAYFHPNNPGLAVLKKISS